MSESKPPRDPDKTDPNLGLIVEPPRPKSADELREVSLLPPDSPAARERRARVPLKRKVITFIRKFIVYGFVIGVALQLFLWKYGEELKKEWFFVSNWHLPHEVVKRMWRQSHQ
jgi:hypothetical protein